MTALSNPPHLLAAQPLPGYLLGPVIADRKQLRQRAQRTLPAIVGRQQLATKIIRIGLRHISCREVQSNYSVHLLEKCSNFQPQKWVSQVSPLRLGNASRPVGRRCGSLGPRRDHLSGPARRNFSKGKHRPLCSHNQQRTKWVQKRAKYRLPITLIENVVFAVGIRATGESWC